MKRTEELSRGTLKKISPLRNKCDCGNKVTDHHWLCNNCWGKMEKERRKYKARKILEAERKKMKRLTREEKIEVLRKQGRLNEL